MLGVYGKVQRGGAAPPVRLFDMPLVTIPAKVQRGVAALPARALHSWQGRVRVLLGMVRRTPFA